MSADPRTMNVACPHCGARYLLPANLLGPGGARVRCPGCSRSFDVPPAGSAAAPEVATREVATEPRTAADRTPVAPSPSSRAFQETPRRPSIAPPKAVPTPAAGALEPLAIAREVLSALSAESGESLSAAASQGSLFSQHGPAIFEAYDQFRRRAPNVGAGPFREALRELWGVDLPEVTPRP